MRKLDNLIIAVIAFSCSLAVPPDLGAKPADRGKILFSAAKISDAFEIISEGVAPAVVQIFATGYTPGGGESVGALLARRHRIGSGFILHPEGYIVTNAHVVEGARRIQILLNRPSAGNIERKSILKPRGRLIGAQLVGFDSETDMAVVKIAETGLPYLKLGDSEDLRPGQIVLAFGSPLGLENSVTMGVVSAVARQLRPEDPMIYIQTDASVNPGNSGGPLVSMDGRVVGINTFIFSQSGGYEGIGFAGPSNILRNVFEQIRTTGRVRRGIIGAEAQNINPVLAAGLGLPQAWGVLISDVAPDGPADSAGLRVGDLVLALAGKVMENSRQFEVNLYRRSIGETVNLEVLRDSRRLTIPVSVIERAEEFENLAGMVSPDKNLVPRLGILAIELDEKISKLLPPLRRRTGVVVADKAVDAPYAEDAFTQGDVIYSINGEPVTSLAELRSAIKSFPVHDPVVFQVERMGRLKFVAIELE